MAIEPIRFTAVPKYLKFAIEIPSPTSEDDEATTIETFKFYLRGPGCPTPIVIDVDNIEVEYEQNYPNNEDRNELGDAAYIAKARRANLLRYRDMLVAISRPQLTFEIADSLANDETEQAGMKILQLTGWRLGLVEDEKESTSDEEDKDKDKEEKTPKGEGETGA